MSMTQTSRASRNRLNLSVAILCLLMLVCWLAIPLMAHATLSDGGVGGGSALAGCYETTQGLTYRIAHCVMETVQGASEKLFVLVAEKMKVAIGAAGTIALILFGYQVALGMPHAEKHGIIFIIKLSLVMWFALEYNEFYQSVFVITEELANLVSNAFTMSGNGCTAGAGGGLMDLWNKVDCILGSLFGFATPKSLGFQTLVTGFITAIVGTIFTGTFSTGIQLFFFGISAYFALLFAIFRAMHIFLTAYITLMLVLGVAPIMVPMALFEFTKRFYEGWLRQLIAYILQPAALFAFLSFFLLVLDTQVVDLMSTFNQAVSFRVDPPGSNWLLTFANEWKEKFGLGAAADINQGRDLANGPEDSAQFSLPFLTIELGGADMIKVIGDLVQKLAAVALLSYIMNTMLAYFPSIGSAIMGIGGGVPNIGSAGMEMPLEKQATGALKGLQQRLTK